MTAVTLSGADRDIDLLIRRAGQNQAEWVSLLPSDRLKDFGRPATVGVRPASTTRLNPVGPCDPDCRDEEGYALLRGGDEIVAVDGVRLPRDEATGAIFEYRTDPVEVPTRERDGYMRRQPNSLVGPLGLMEKAIPEETRRWLNNMETTSFCHQCFCPNRA
jgi:hypothetical protein